MKSRLPTVRFSKPSAPFMELNRPFFDPVGQDDLVEESARLYEIYRRQPPRTACKNCATPLGPATFIKQNISYYVCDVCGHLTGHYEDTEEFYRACFSDDGGAIVASHYAAADRTAFEQRVAAVYAPKLDFLWDVLVADGADPKVLGYADVGTGLGHFIKAMLDRGIRRATGYEPSSLLVQQGNELLGDHHLEVLAIPELAALAPQLKAEVITMVFVLEHLQDPRGILEAFARNPAVRYLLISVPVHSPSGYFELMFPTVYERHLSGHTHLYTDQSLQWLCNKVGLERIGEWWFGADAMDLFRSCRTRLRQLGQPQGAIRDWEQMMIPLIDGFQETMDRHKVSSEIHLVLKVHR
ncbi:MAG: class I SAM-dependent methyltransferase [Fimbriimonadaceae bacterium]|nr:class I SAM-dependent methyltransferase [Alphaproteobacteria bacterium]